MKRIILILATTILVFFALGCRKERWLRVYHAGVFEDSINVTGWEPNEDVVWLSEFFYPWQGEDSIFYRAVNYDTQNQVPTPAYLEVNGKLVGISSDYSRDIPDSGSILTIIYKPHVFVYDTILPDLSFIERFPNLVGISMDLFFFLDVKHIDDVPHIKILDAIPSRMRLYMGCYHVSDGELAALSRYSNIRTLRLGGNEIALSTSGIEHLWRIKELRILSLPHHIEKKYDEDPSSDPSVKFPKYRGGYITDPLW